MPPLPCFRLKFFQDFGRPVAGPLLLSTEATWEVRVTYLDFVTCGKVVESLCQHYSVQPLIHNVTEEEELEYIQQLDQYNLYSQKGLTAGRGAILVTIS